MNMINDGWANCLWNNEEFSSELPRNVSYKLKQLSQIVITINVLIPSVIFLIKSYSGNAKWLSQKILLL